MIVLYTVKIPFNGISIYLSIYLYIFPNIIHIYILIYLPDDIFIVSLGCQVGPRIRVAIRRQLCGVSAASAVACGAVVVARARGGAERHSHPRAAGDVTWNPWNPWNRGSFGKPLGRWQNMEKYGEDGEG